MYEGVGRALVVGLKRRPRRAALAVLAPALATLVPAPLVDVVTWAPTSGARRRQRGYDQAELLARGVARALGVPCRRLLRRTDRAGPQEGRTRAERLAGPAFTLTAPPPAGARRLAGGDPRTPVGGPHGPP